jgi:hypothetical protein
MSMVLKFNFEMCFFQSQWLDISKHLVSVSYWKTKDQSVFFPKVYVLPTILTEKSEQIFIIFSSKQKDILLPFKADFLYIHILQLNVTHSFSISVQAWNLLNTQLIISQHFSYFFNMCISSSAMSSPNLEITYPTLKSFLPDHHNLHPSIHRPSNNEVLC